MHIILLLLGLVVILRISSYYCWDWWSSYAYHLAAVEVGGHLFTHIILLLFWLGLILGISSCC